MSKKKNPSPDFAVRVLDENDNPPKFSLAVYKAEIQENNAPGMHAYI